MRHFHQTATYWEATGTTDIYGKPTFKAPVQLKCRWEDKVQQFINKRGTEVVSKSKVYLADQIMLDGYMFLGTSTEVNPIKVKGASEIQQVGVTPDLRFIRNLTTVWL